MCFGPLVACCWHQKCLQIDEEAAICWNLSKRHLHGDFLRHVCHLVQCLYITRLQKPFHHTFRSIFALVFNKHTRMLCFITCWWSPFRHQCLSTHNLSWDIDCRVYVTFAKHSSDTSGFSMMFFLSLFHSKTRYFASGPRTYVYMYIRVHVGRGGGLCACVCVCLCVFNGRIFEAACHQSCWISLQYQVKSRMLDLNWKCLRVVLHCVLKKSFLSFFLFFSRTTVDKPPVNWLRDCDSD